MICCYYCFHKVYFCAFVMIFLLLFVVVFYYDYYYYYYYYKGGITSSQMEYWSQIRFRYTRAVSFVEMDLEPVITTTITKIYIIFFKEMSFKKTATTTITITIKHKIIYYKSNNTNFNSYYFGNKIKEYNKL